MSNKMENSFDVMVIGAGAAGVFSAINIKTFHPQLRVAILEKTHQSLSKVKVSGGGRCNVTHACFDPKELIKFYPRGTKELRGPFAVFQPSDTIQWFAERNITLKTEEDGRMFPDSDSSQTIIDCFHQELRQLEIPILYQQKIEKITPHENQFIIDTIQESYACKRMVITTGGFNKLEQYQFINQLGISIIPPTPSLFTFNLPQHDLLQLQGIVSQVNVKLLGTKMEESGPLLITHWGVSGPAILKLSSWAARYLHEQNYEFDFRVNWLPSMNEELLKETLNNWKQNYGAKKVINHFELDIPKKLQVYLLNKSTIDENTKWADVTKKQLNKLIDTLLNDVYHSQGKTTFKKEFVSCGGVQLNEINFKTMESKKVPGIYFAGEVLDIDALTGGFNFQAAWTTGYIAAQHIATSFEAE